MIVGRLVLGCPKLQAQGAVLGTFRWQLVPHCNVVTLRIEQQGETYALSGTDDVRPSQRRPGHLCLYEGVRVNAFAPGVLNSLGAVDADPTGAQVLVASVAAGFTRAFGKWAVTLP